LRVRLHTVALPEDVKVIGETLGWLGLPDLGTEVTAVLL